MHKEKGFTLVELMIVVGIVAVLAAVAIPAYKNYVVRAKISEGLNIVGSVKLAVAETYQSTGAFPTSNSSAGLPDTISSTMVSGITVGTSGIITIAYNNTATGLPSGSDTLTLTPSYGNGTISWVCAGSVDNKYKPASCRS